MTLGGGYTLTVAPVEVERNTPSKEQAPHKQATARSKRSFSHECSLYSGSSLECYAVGTCVADAIVALIAELHGLDAKLPHSVAVALGDIGSEAMGIMADAMTKRLSNPGDHGSQVVL